MTTTAGDTAPLSSDTALTPADIVAPGRVALADGADGPVVTVVGTPTRRTASLLSCRLHEAIARATDGVALVVDLGAASAADPAIERVLLCARESATSRGLTFHVR